MSTNWDRLVETFARNDMTVTVDAFQGMRKNIHVRQGEFLIIVSDTWWHSNTDIWTGWQVYVEKDGLVKWQYNKTKKRSEVVQQVQRAITTIVK